MAEVEDIKRELGKFAGRYAPTVLQPAKVTEVHDDHTVTVELGSGAVVDGVRLKAVIKDGDYFVLVPAVDSVVQVAALDGSDELLVIGVDAITSIESKIGDSSLKIDGEGFVFGKGTDTLAKLMADLIDAMILERHMTTSGPSISLTAESVTKYNALKIRFEDILKQA